MPKLIECPTCSNKISTEARTCPSCHQPEPFELYQSGLKGQIFDGTVTHAARSFSLIDIGHLGLYGKLTHYSENPPKEGAKIKVQVKGFYAHTLSLKKM
jgi:uncharacterized OB-fold protein